MSNSNPDVATKTAEGRLFSTIIPLIGMQETLENIENRLRRVLDGLVGVEDKEAAVDKPPVPIETATDFEGILKGRIDRIQVHIQETLIQITRLETL